MYSSFPLQGAARSQTTAVVNGIKLALEEVGGKAGDIKVTYKSLDDSTAQAGNWTPEATSANARKAAQDKSTAVYLGEFNSGASAVSIPILNEAGVPQISPANTAVGLTTDEPGADAGEPDKYYPTGQRTYARIVPKDTIQGAALATLMKQDGCTKVQLLNDKEVYGAGLARNIEASAKSQGLTVISNEAIDKNAPNYRSLASKAQGAGADCMVFSGIVANNAVQIYKDFAAALPNAKLYGPDGVAQSDFADPKQGLPANVGARTKVTIATLSPDQYPPEGQKFFDDFKAKYGVKNPDPYAIYGYEAARLALDAIQRSKTGKKEDVLKALFDTKDRQSVLGTYSIDENGDTSLTDYGVYSIKKGVLTFDETIKAKAG
jgi:branched-chain amino acid transport system substrate-binding protein